MLLTMFTLHRSMRCRQSTRWRALLVGLLLISCAGVAWAQPPGLPIDIPIDIPGDIPIDIPGDIPIDIPGDIPIDIPGIPTPGVAPPLFGALEEGVDATANQVVDFMLDRGFVLSGQIITPGTMASVVGGAIFAASETETYRGTISFAFDPTNSQSQMTRYRIVLPAGTYDMSALLSLFGGSISEPIPLAFVLLDLDEMVVVSGDTERDLTAGTLPEFFTVSGQVSNPGDYPARGGLIFRSQDGRVFNSSALVEFATEGAASVDYSIMLPAETYDVSYTPLFEDPVDPTNPMLPEPDPEISQQQFLVASVGTVVVSGNETFDIPLPATVTLSGMLTDAAGVSLAGASVFATTGLLIPEDPAEEGEPPAPEPPAPFLALCQTGSVAAIPNFTSAGAMLPEDNTLGTYEMSVVPLPEAYHVGVMAPVELLPPATVPPSTLSPQEGELRFPFPPDMITITTDQVRNFMSPSVSGVVLISGNVTDEMNLPVSGAEVEATSSMLTMTPNVLFTNEVKTDEMGDYQLLVLSGMDYTLRACPPGPSNTIVTPMP